LVLQEHLQLALVEVEVVVAVVVQLVLEELH
jgi:hypothetical protein